MLPKNLKIGSSAEFSQVVSGASRAGTKRVVAYYSRACEEREPQVSFGGPHFGLIVSKAVGNAVIRHRVARRLRHICAELANELDRTDRVVIRALPASADAPAGKLEDDVRRALARSRRRFAERTAQSH
ncbi:MULTISPECIES: ribonuclease P protein component [Corynebacterium]|uniref:ribonuclease P protein component n=1 Tax=Corynebacterium TaxID=1716 RepID=UPI00124E4557|nr:MULTISPECIES: ribonuclease P protein component [Corynebacterium]